MTSLEETVRARFDVVSRVGDELLVRCPDPDHEDRNPSAAINLTKRLWCCYACGAGGRLADLFSGTSDLVLDEPDTDDLLAQVQRDVAELDRTHTVMPERWLAQFLGSPHPYWIERGFTAETIAQFQLGFDPWFQPRRDDPYVEAATIPLREPTGGLLGVIHRRLDGAKPKYHYPAHADVSACLFAYERVRGGCAHVVLCEGAVDAIALWQEGIPALAAYSDRLSAAQTALIRSLDPLTVTLAFDADNVGQRAVSRILYGERKRGRVVDPADFGASVVAVAEWDPVEGKDICDLAPTRRCEVIEDARVHT